MGDPRFYLDHGMIHDRVTGKHVTTDGTPPFEDSIEQVCELLNSLCAPAVGPSLLAILRQRAHDLRRCRGNDGVDPAIETFCADMLDGIIKDAAAASTVEPSDIDQRIALWMTRHGYATGHGDSIEDMLGELEGQAKEHALRPGVEASQEGAA